MQCEKIFTRLLLSFLSVKYFAFLSYFTSIVLQLYCVCVCVFFLLFVAVLLHTICAPVDGIELVCTVEIIMLYRNYFFSNWIRFSLGLYRCGCVWVCYTSMFNIQPEFALLIVGIGGGVVLKTNKNQN